MDKIDMKICPSCSGNINEEKTTFTLDSEYGILIIRDVPTFVCSVCGDKWYSDSISDKLDKYIVEARNIYNKIHDDLIITRFEGVA